MPPSGRYADAVVNLGDNRWQFSNARKIVGFRNQLVHDYVAIKDEIVWAIVQHDAPVLRDECLALIDGLERAN